MPDIEPKMDHLVYATPDLESTVDRFQQDTGVSPAAGGRHLGRGTRNYLVGLGPHRYLEIIGPDVGNPVAPGVGMPFGIGHLLAPALVTWAVRPDDIEVAAEASKVAGADFGRARPMSRRTPAGDLLTWRLASTVPLPLDGVVPFLIDWGTARHPASDAGIPQLGLLEFAITHPQTAEVQAVLDAVDVKVVLRQGAPGLRAVLETPKGQVALD